MMPGTTLLSTSSERSKRCLDSHVAVLSCLAGGTLYGTGFNLSMSSAIAKVWSFLPTMNLCSKYFKHFTRDIMLLSFPAFECTLIYVSHTNFAAIEKCVARDSCSFWTLFCYALYRTTMSSISGSCQFLKKWGNMRDYLVEKYVVLSLVVKLLG